MRTDWPTSTPDGSYSTLRFSLPAVLCVDSTAGLRSRRPRSRPGGWRNTPDLRADGDQRGRVDEVNAHLLDGTVPAKGTRCG
ncbi:hypothetical protein [Microbispora sp. NBRC 16548]|uniref:hypothetical protein n=1 Tax=Microbispora sp. NBRC 16548 TaxID=3030994 RepID=UPI00160ED35A|nr:hypothetical protein [Microbispora sp. NBRC 16548]GLX04796.1 hypothetical protein Misp03_17230 [Microbispora sp. NBRC 16548]